MGQRANYIIKAGDKRTIYYNHWRANCIAADLYLGPKRFMEFVKRCTIEDEILSEPWLEGCVIIDPIQKELFFWSFEFSRDTSVVDYYLEQLGKKWENWTLRILKNRMYDAAKVLAIDDVSEEELQPVNKPLKEDIIADKVEEWSNTLVIIRQDSSLFVTKTGNLTVANILSYGQDVLALMQEKPTYDLPREGDEGTYSCLFIDVDNQRIYANESIIGLIAMSKTTWPGYELTGGDFGYIETLRFAGLDTSSLVLSHDEVKRQFLYMVQVNDHFDPFEMAEKIKQTNKDVQFNPYFFDHVKPEKPFLYRLKAGIKKLWKGN